MSSGSRRCTATASPTRLWGIEDLLDDLGEPVLWCAGFWDALLVRSLGLVSVTPTQGEWTLPRRQDVEKLRGRPVLLCLDRDEPGVNAEAKVLRALEEWAGAASVRVLRLPGLTGAKGSKDLTDWWRARCDEGTASDAARRLRALVEAAGEESAEEAQVEKLAKESLRRKRAEQRAKEMLADRDAGARRERLPDFRAVDTAAWLRARPRRRVVVGSEETGVVMRPGHMARLLSDYKAGKTTDGLDWVRCSLTGEPWLGYFPVVPIPDDRVVVYIDPELGDDDGRDYIAQAFAGCSDDVVSRVRRIDLHEAAGFDWRSSIDRAWLAEQCEGAARIFFDSVLQVLPGTAVDDDAVKTFLGQLEALKFGVGADELLYAMHMNRQRDARSFGSVMWDVNAQALLAKFVEKDESGDRFYLRGDRGRAGTGFREGRVVLGDDGRPLFLPESTRSADALDSRATALRTWVENTLVGMPWQAVPVTTTDVKEAMGWTSKSYSQAAIFDRAENAGYLHRVTGPKNAKHIHPGTAAACPVCDAPTKIRVPR